MSRATATSVPTQAHDLAGLDRVDYQDAFAVRSPAPLTTDQWARLLIDGAPPVLRRLIYRVHKHLLGLRVEPAGSPNHLLGWELHGHGTDAVALAVDGGVITPRIVLSRSDGQVVAATLIRFDRLAARPIWAVVGPLHRAVARYLLGHAADVAEQRAEIGT
jgi:hypothetical protein